MNFWQRLKAWLKGEDQLPPLHYVVCKGCQKLRPVCCGKGVAPIDGWCKECCPDHLVEKSGAFPLDRGPRYRSVISYLVKRAVRVEGDLWVAPEPCKVHSIWCVEAWESVSKVQIRSGSLNSSRRHLIAEVCPEVFQFPFPLYDCFVDQGATLHFPKGVWVIAYVTQVTEEVE